MLGKKCTRVFLIMFPVCLSIQGGQKQITTFTGGPHLTMPNPSLPPTPPSAANARTCAPLCSTVRLALK